MFKVLLSLFLFMFMHCAFADKATIDALEDRLLGEVSLSEDEVAAIEELGLGDKIDQISSGQIDELKGKLNQEVESGLKWAEGEYHRIKNEVDGYIADVESEVEAVSEGIEDDVSTMARGYGMSMLSLTLTGILAPRVLMTCRTKPSAVIYVGSAAVYIGREIVNTRKFKASQLSEIKVISNFEIDSSNTYNENLDAAKYAVDMQTQYLKSYKSVLSRGFESIEDKAKNMRQFSYGLGVASAAAAAETYFGSGTCGKPAVIDESSIGQSLPDTDQYIAGIMQAQNLTQAFQYYYRWENQALGLNMEMSLEQMSEIQALEDSFQNNPDSPFSDKKQWQNYFRQALGHSLEIMSGILISQAHASKDYSSQVQFEKQTVIAEADTELADFIGDVDKIGALLIGGGFELAMRAFVPGYNQFLNNVAANGVSRSVAFGAHGALAYFASKDLENAAGNFLERIDRVDALIDRINSDVKGTIDYAYLTDEMAADLEAFANKHGIQLPKPANEMTLEETSDFLDGLKNQGLNQAEEFFNDLDTDQLIQDQIPKNSSEDYEGAYLAPLLKSLVSIFLPTSAYAQSQPQSYDIRKSTCIDIESCPPPQFPSFNSERFNALNQLIGEYAQYSQAVFRGDERREKLIGKRFDEGPKRPDQLRTQIYSHLNQRRQSQGHEPLDFKALEKKMLDNYQNSFERRFERLPETEQSKILAGVDLSQVNTSEGSFNSPRNGLDTASRQASEQYQQRLSRSQLQTLQALVARIESHDKGSERHPSKLETNDDYDEFNSFIHASHLSIFDVIHRRYQSKMRNNEI